MGSAVLLLLLLLSSAGVCQEPAFLFANGVLSAVASGGQRLADSRGRIPLNCSVTRLQFTSQNFVNWSRNLTFTSAKYCPDLKSQLNRAVASQLAAWPLEYPRLVQPLVGGGFRLNQQCVPPIETSCPPIEEILLSDLMMESSVGEASISSNWVTAACEGSPSPTLSPLSCALP